MFRITEDPSSGRLVQFLAKNYKNDSIVSVVIFSQALHKATWRWILCDTKYIGKLFNIL